MPGKSALTAPLSHSKPTNSMTRARSMHGLIWCCRGGAGAAGEGLMLQWRGWGGRGGGAGAAGEGLVLQGRDWCCRGGAGAAGEGLLLQGEGLMLQGRDWCCREGLVLQGRGWCCRGGAGAGEGLMLQGGCTGGVDAAWEGLVLLGRGWCCLVLYVCSEVHWIALGGTAAAGEGLVL